MNYKIYTLGCKLNYAESFTIARNLETDGWIKACKGEVANLVIINSCSVTSQADHKARELIRRAVRENSGAEVIVTGCYAKLKGDEISRIDGVTRVEADKSKIVSHHLGGDTFFAAYSTGERVRSFLKVQDGCDYHCSYCTVWRARGESRNAPIAAIVAQANEIAAKGVREIVLTGVNIGDFGKSTGESFLDLITALDSVKGIERYRISSIEPNLLTDEIIAFCKQSSKLMAHFHIPLQSGCDTVLKRMGRRYTAAFFAEKIATIRRSMPDVFIGVDVIVGFAGESDAHFQATYNLLNTIRPSYLHIFPYSQRDNTAAAKFADQVSPIVKKARAAKLEALNVELQKEFYDRWIESPHLVLVEGRDKRSGRLFGHTENFIRVELDGDNSAINTIVAH